MTQQPSREVDDRTGDSPDADPGAGPAEDTGFGGEPTTEASSAIGWDPDAVDEDAVR